MIRVPTSGTDALWGIRTTVTITNEIVLFSPCQANNIVCTTLIQST